MLISGSNLSTIPALFQLFSIIACAKAILKTNPAKPSAASKVLSEIRNISVKKEETFYGT